MMGKQDTQIQMMILDLDAMIPEKHLLRQIKNCVNFDFIYEKAAPYYSHIGRKSIDPVVMVKMLLIGYLYGIKSERRLEEEVSLNLAYRWFCGLNLTERVPDHTVFSKNRQRRFRDESIFRDIFVELVRVCIEKGIVDGETMVADGSFIPANVSKESKYDMVCELNKSTVSYLKDLDQELSTLPGYKNPISSKIEKTVVKSRTDSECGYIHQERKKGLGYLTEMTIDTKYGIITGVDCYPANRRESDIILEHIKKQQESLKIGFKDFALDAGYDVGAVHRGLEILNITGYCSTRDYHNHAMKKGFEYQPEKDNFLCQNAQTLDFESIIYKKSQQNYYRIYSKKRSECKSCPNIEICAVDKGKIRINASAYYPSFYQNIQRSKTSDYLRMKKLRSIWSEGTFAVLKREHNLRKIHKRGIVRATEECLLAAGSVRNFVFMEINGFFLEMN